MSSNTLVKRVFDELTKLDDIGFKTWISSVRELASRYNISLDNEQPIEIFKRECQEKLECHFVAKWLHDINDEAHNSITRTYKLFKTTYELVPYLDLAKNPKYRTAISRLRTSSHMLEIERGRHTRPIGDCVPRAMKLRTKNILYLIALSTGMRELSCMIRYTLSTLLLWKWCLIASLYFYLHQIIDKL